MPLEEIAINELIAARRALHGPNRGRPNNDIDGQPKGRALNRACVVMLGAELQREVERVFFLCAERVFRRQLSDDEKRTFGKTWERWGNPSADNIIRLFNRLGCVNVFDGLSWRGMTTANLRGKLNGWNEVRNDIAHGTPLRMAGADFSLTLAKFENWKKVAVQFGNRFEAHALSKFQV